MTDVEDLQATSPLIANEKVCKLMVRDLAAMETCAFSDITAFDKTITQLARKYKCRPSKRDLGLVYRQLLKSEPAIANAALSAALINKSIRSESGILNVSVSMPPDKFSCKYNCHFCPNEPGMPRSYLSNEDVFARAAQVDFDTVQQVHSRLRVLENNGHPLDKVEFRVLGGTFSCYDHRIADDFIRDLYYAANTYYASEERPRGSIAVEQSLNVTTKIHVVGLGIETRPDEINEAEIIRFRRYGVTRVELGVQHTDDSLLRRVNRGHLVSHSRAAIKLLKDYGFKVEIHIMTDLPGATPEGDMECYRQVLREDPDLIPDYMKDYPCLDVSYTLIKKWKEEGKWTPYSERTTDAADLKRVLIYRQSITPKWVRVNRIQRDFRPATCGQLGYTSDSIRSNLAQLVKDEAEAAGIYCQCIRCCEVHNQKYDVSEIEYNVYPFLASGALEYFIAAEVPRPNRNLLLGFLRLRFSEALRTSIVPELEGETAMIRELHVYGRVKEVGVAGATATQHLGIGKKLLSMAEEISVAAGMSQIAVISGIGVRDYYRKRGYELRGTYMMKTLNLWMFTDGYFFMCLMFLIIVVSILIGTF